MGPLAQSRVLLGVVARGPGLILLEEVLWGWGQDQVCVAGSEGDKCVLCSIGVVGWVSF